MKKLKKFEDWNIQNDNYLEEFDLNKILYNLPHNNIHKNKNREYVMSAIKYLDDKFVSFVRSSYKNKSYTYITVSGYVEDFDFDSACRYPVFLKIKGDDDWHNVCDGEPIIINNVMSDANKYNL